MPTTYAHDVFGKAVYHRLPPLLKMKVKRNLNLFRIGLHGPDILFYYHPYIRNKVHEKGVLLHQETADGFFENCKSVYQETQDEKVLVYTLGFICHFMLDSTCHPYINQFIKEHESCHDEVESDFDRILMEKTGKDPFVFHPSDAIVPKMEYARVIHEVLPDIPTRKIYHSLILQKIMTNRMVYRFDWQRNTALTLLKVSGQYRNVHGHIIRKERTKEWVESSNYIWKLFCGAIPKTADLVIEYAKEVESSDPINPRFERNYK